MQFLQIARGPALAVALTHLPGPGNLIAGPLLSTTLSLVLLQQPCDTTTGSGLNRRENTIEGIKTYNLAIAVGREYYLSGNAIRAGQIRRIRDLKKVSARNSIT